MSILDTILNGADQGPRIISEQHDLGQINAQAALLDEAELGKMYSREQIEAMRNDPQRLEEAKEAAIRRASLDTSTGKVSVMVAGEAAWHGLGVNVTEAVSSEHAIRLASMDWLVGKVPLAYMHDGKGRVAPDTYALVRQDTGAMLGVAGSIYQPIQNEDGFSFLDAVLQQYGARYETCGSIFGGKKVWMLATVPELAFEAVPGDEVKPYVLFSNSHVPGESAACFPTGHRVVCANTHRLALADGKGKGIRIAHRGNLDEKIGDAQAALRLSVDAFSQFREQADTLVHTPIPKIEHYANDVLDAVLDVTAAQALLGADVFAASLNVTEAARELAAKSYARKIKRRGEVLDDILERYDSERCGISGIRGTAWAAWNSITEHADHGKRYSRGSDEEKASRRFENVLVGEADDMKQTALEMALAYAV